MKEINAIIQTSRLDVVLGSLAAVDGLPALTVSSV